MSQRGTRHCQHFTLVTAHMPLVLLLVIAAVASFSPAATFGPSLAGHAAAQEIGTARGVPAPVGTEVVSGNLGIAVMETRRGEDAFARLKEANAFNAPRPADEEYVLVRVRVRHTGEGDPIEVDGTAFGLTASGNVVYPAVAAVPPDPLLGATLYPGDQSQGWVALRVGKDETHRQLIYLPEFQEQYERWRFLALEEDAALPVGDPTAPAPNDVGITRDRPAAPGETAATPYFAVQFLEGLVGSEATARLKETDALNTDPQEGWQHILAKVQVTSRIAEDYPVFISAADFAVVGKADSPYFPSYAFVPVPDLYALLYPGGTVEGWISFEIKADEDNPTLVHLWLEDPDPQPRFFAMR